MGRDVAGYRPVRSNGSNQAQMTAPEKANTKESEPDNHKHEERGASSSTGDEAEENVEVVETDDSGTNDQHSPTTTKKSHTNSSKPRHSHDGSVSEEEESCSFGSSQRTNKSKVTVPVGPRFVCEDRLERRREYYTELEERRKALEKEKLEAEARQREEEAAAIKQLRKSMVYKANPIPSFYREGHNTKAPPTHAKSPKLTRRRSFGDAGKNSARDQDTRERGGRRSPAPSRPGKGKERTGGRKSVEISIPKDDQVKQEQDDEAEE